MVYGLDIGSNTFSLVELRPGTNGIDIINDISLVARLSEGLTDGGRLMPQAVFRGLEVLETLVERYTLRQQPLRAVGTAVLRMAQNPELFLDPAKKILGCEVEVITGEEEALLVSRGAILGLMQKTPWIVADVGGQSTEICWEEPPGQFNPLSLPIGVVGLTRRFLRSDPPTPAEIEALSAEVRRIIQTALPSDIEGELVGVAGTATTLGMIDLQLTSWQRDKVHGFKMSEARLNEWQDRIQKSTTKARQERYGVRPGRADVFPAGIVVLKELMTHLQKNRFTISANGLRVGVALELLNKA